MIFSEDSRVKIPCILHLVRLGYQYLRRFRNWFLVLLMNDQITVA